MPSLALADLLIQRPDLLPPAQELDPRGSPLRSSPTSPADSRSALVPACGFGWDALLLASFGYNVWALDVSSTAIEKAKEIEKESLEKDWYKTREHFDRGTITWITADFFDQDWAKNTGVDGTGKFDLIFDYTVRLLLEPKAAVVCVTLTRDLVPLRPPTSDATPMVPANGRTPPSQRSSSLPRVPLRKAAIEWRAAVGALSRSVRGSFDLPRRAHRVR